ncbi:AAA family ATPase [Streptomyces sp. YC504]|uniref:AAA family ATPase n=1 Tax=Streptomyces mesophilus TaxID=1775132 RepID=A0A6G4XK65_9ACTN|nr:AAA family ATPase [Streptomyces mesophilus]NGO77808.1 AAA family ATPase [Streptomyces mesophilus]
MDDARQTTGSSDTAPVLRLHLMGGFRAIREEGPAAPERWPRPSAQALVKLLAVTPGHRLHREQAMALCWPEADQQSATGSLRVALHAARRALEPELTPRAASSYLISDGAFLRLDPATVQIDADRIEHAARTALDSGRIGELGAVLDEFTGELLPEDRYANWARARRDQLAALREEVLLALAAAHMAQGSPAEAIGAAEQVLATSPAEELAHRVLIDAYVRQGLRRRAVHQYHLCREALDTELGVRPGPETERLHRVALASPPALSPAIRPTLPAPLRGIRTTPLHGRGAELSRLLADEGPPVRLLTGEAGVGKTRLAGEAARRAVAAGTVVLWGAGHDAEGHTPYGVFAEALDGWLAERSVAERARVGAEYPELAAFLPSLGQVPAVGERSPEEERDRLFRATAGLLGELAAQQPVVLVLDDLHAADTGSYQLLSHLARRGGGGGPGARFLVTYREEELPETDPRRADLAALVRQRLAGVEPVHRLGRDACLAVARDAGGGVEAQRVWELSLGNPLFALELARGPLDTAGGVAPDGVRQLVAERLARLDHDTRRIVEALSAAGAKTATSELLDVAEHGLHPPVRGAAATEALERALGAALIEERPVVVSGRQEPGLAFRHPLVRLTCYEGLSAVRRRQLHGAFAQTVQRRRPDAVDTLAAHFARADDPRAADYLRRAAERAAALYANDTADRYYRDLVARLDVDAARARLAHAHVLRRMGHFEQAAEALRLALAEFERRQAHDDAVLAAAVLAETLVKTSGTGTGAGTGAGSGSGSDTGTDAGPGLGSGTGPGSGSGTGPGSGSGTGPGSGSGGGLGTGGGSGAGSGKSNATAVGRRLLRDHPVTADTAPEPAACHFLALAVIRCVQGRYTDGAEAARQALAAAGKVPGAPGQGLAAKAFAMQAVNLGLNGRFDEAREAGDQALAPAEAYGDPTLLGSVLSTLRENARRAGRLQEAVETGTRALGLAERSGDPTAAAFEQANLAELHLLLEEPEPARALAEQAVAGAEAYDAWCLPYALVTLALVRLRLDAPARAAALLDRAATVATTLGDRQAEHEVRTARAELALRAHRPADALSALDGHTDDAPVSAAWAELLVGRPESALTLARAEVSRAERTGERLAEVEARIALGASLHRAARPGEGAGELARAESLAGVLPYPAGVRRVAWAREILITG